MNAIQFQFHFDHWGIIDYIVSDHIIIALSSSLFSSPYSFLSSSAPLYSPSSPSPSGMSSVSPPFSYINELEFLSKKMSEIEDEINKLMEKDEGKRDMDLIHMNRSLLKKFYSRYEKVLDDAPLPLSTVQEDRFIEKITTIMDSELAHFAASQKRIEGTQERIQSTQELILSQVLNLVAERDHQKRYLNWKNKK